MADAAPIAFFPAQQGAEQGGEGNATGADNSGGGAGQRKPRGRPPGSKNKPKPTVVITRESEAVMRTLLFELTVGWELVDCVYAYARGRRLGVSLLSGCGALSDVVLRHPGCSSPVTYRGLFDIITISGMFLPSVRRVPSSSSYPAAPAVTPHFTVALSGAQGQVFGGVLERALVASGSVKLLMAVFVNPEYHRLLEPRREDQVDEECRGTAVGSEETQQNNQMPVVEPPPSSAPMDMVYNVAPAGGINSEVPAEVATPWSSHAARGAASSFRHTPNHRGLY